MSIVFRISAGLVSLLLAGMLSGSSGHSSNPSPLIQQRIDALLKHRLKPEPLPTDPPNPFQVPSGSMRDLGVDGNGAKAAIKATSEVNANTPAVLPAGDASSASSAEVLAGCVARLKIGGLIRMRDQIQIVVNDVPRKEGDIIVVDWNNTAIQLRVVHVQPNQLTLHYGDADVILKY
jgi:hypothetical protein